MLFFFALNLFVPQLVQLGKMGNYTRKKFLGGKDYSPFLKKIEYKVHKICWKYYQNKNQAIQW